MKVNNLPVLLEIAEKMNSTVELDDILPSIVEVAKEYIGAERVSVFLIVDNKLELKAYAGFDPGERVIIPLGVGITGEVAVAGVPKIVNNGTFSEKHDQGYTATSYMSLPIKSKDGVIGVLNVTDKFNDFFDEDDLRVAEYIAFQCSLAVERHTLYEKMRGNERLQIMGMLRASVAHDIRNLLGIVEVYLSLMEDFPDQDTVQEYLVAIRTEIGRVRGLTEDIMDYSKQKIKLNYSKFDLAELCEEITQQLNLSLRFTDLSVMNRSANEVVVNADRDRLYRVIFNLANNAVQAVEDTGGVVSIAARSHHNCATVIVIDNGKGIPKDLITGIFDPFVSSGKAKGTGLGLAIVKEVIHGHNGKIKVRSKQGSYTAFRISLPVKGVK